MYIHSPCWPMIYLFFWIYADEYVVHMHALLSTYAIKHQNSYIDWYCIVVKIYTLHEWTGMLPISLEVTKMGWKWIGHINRMPPTYYSKNSHAPDPCRKQEAGTTKRDAEKVRGTRDEGSRVALGPGREAGSEQNTMASPFLGVGLMCEHARKGLSK